MSGDGINTPVDRNAFPYLRERGDVALIGVSTARATAPFMANGFFMEGQAGRLGKILARRARQGLFRVIMIHHPPVRGAVSQQKRLFGIARFHKIIRRHGAELVLHGHSHLPSLFFIGTRGGPEFRWSASPPPARRRAASTRRRSTICSTSTAKRAIGGSSLPGVA